MTRSLVLACLMLACTATHAAEKPNVLFIFLDDFGWRDCSYMGSDYFQTPALDALAAEGLIFTDAYAAAANCAPSRACLLSGQYSPRHEIYNVGTGLRGNPKFSRLKHVAGTDTLRTDISTWAHQAQAAGYQTGTIGKWHLSKDPLPYGFDFNFAGSHSGSPPRGYFPPHPGAPGLDDASKDEYLTDRLSEEAIGFMRRNRDRPWLLYLTHFAVHTPLQAPKDLIEKNAQRQRGDLHSNATMAAMIESVDTGVAQIVDELKALGEYENTVIIFTSDNGGYGPATSMAPLKGYKGTYYEGGIRVPMFIRWPGRTEPGSKTSAPVINVDLYPTLCEITGAELPAQDLDGKSLTPLIDGNDEDFQQRSLYWHFPAYLQGYSRVDQQRDPIFRTRPCSIMRKGKWKLHEYFEDSSLELYDLSVDVGESKNLADSQPEILAALQQELSQWRGSTSAPVPSAANPLFNEKAESAERKRLIRKANKSPKKGR